MILSIYANLCEAKRTTAFKSIERKWWFYSDFGSTVDSLLSCNLNKIPNQTYKLYVLQREKKSHR